MPEGKINFTQCQDTNGKKPHYKGFLTIGDEVHEFAVWPAKTGNGWSGRYKPKSSEEVRANIKHQADVATFEGEIPF